MPAGRTSQGRERFLRVLVTVLRDQCLSRREAHEVIADSAELPLPADQMHLDARGNPVPYGAMMETGGIEIRAQSPIQVLERVEIECGGYTRCVVVGGHHHASVLDHVDT